MRWKKQSSYCNPWQGGFARATDTMANIFPSLVTNKLKSDKDTWEGATRMPEGETDLEYIDDEKEETNTGDELEIESATPCVKDKRNSTIQTTW